MVEHGTYETEDQLMVEYEYTYDRGDWEQPPHRELEIKKITFCNGEDLHYVIQNIAIDYYDNLIEPIQEHIEDNL